MDFEWVEGYEIKLRIEKGAAVISANREGLLSLANHLKTLAGSEGKDHFHLDCFNSLEDGSAELIVEKTE